MTVSHRRRFLLLLPLVVALAMLCVGTSHDLHAQAPATSTFIVRLRPDASPKTLIDRMSSLTDVIGGSVRLRQALDLRPSALMATHSLDRYYIATVPTSDFERVLD